MRFQLQLLALLSLLTAAIQALTPCDCLSRRYGPVDVTFVIDGSKDVGQDNFKLTLTDVAAVTRESLHIGPTEKDSREAMVVFHGESSIEFQLDGVSNADVDQKINAVQYPTQQTGVNIALGMDAATRDIFNRDQRSAGRYMIIVTGNSDISDVRAERSLAKEIGVTVIAIGVGAGASHGQLVNATGDDERVIMIKDYTELLDALRRAMCFMPCLPLPTTTPPPTTTTTTAPITASGAKSARGCACDYRQTWLDLVFVLDSSSEMNRYDFYAVRNFAASFIKAIPVSQETTGRTSRVGIINVAKEAEVVGDLHSYADAKAAYHAMRRVHYKGEEAMNLRKGLEAARDMIKFEDRPNVKKVVIVFTNKHEDCTYQGKHAELFKQKMKKPDEDDNPCRIASHLIENKVIVFTVALKYDGAQDYPKVNLGSPCFNYNFDRTFATNFLDGICRANCYCLPPYVQYSHEDRCIEYGECLYVYGQVESQEVAEQTCVDAKSSLVDVYSHDKELFIDEIQKDHHLKGSWLALKATGGEYQWNGDRLNPQDYTDWAKGQPNTSAGSCVAYEPGQGWLSKSCDDFLTTAHFVGQKISCDALHYCDFKDFTPTH